jgi:hypothetical protein
MDEQQRARHWAETHGHSHKKVHAQRQHVLEEQQHIARQGGHAAPGDHPHGGALQAKLYDKNRLPTDMDDEQQRARHWAETHGHSHKEVHAQPQHVLEEPRGEGGGRRADGVDARLVRALLDCRVRRAPALQPCARGCSMPRGWRRRPARQLTPCSLCAQRTASTRICFVKAKHGTRRIVRERANDEAVLWETRSPSSRSRCVRACVCARRNSARSRALSTRSLLARRAGRLSHDARSPGPQTGVCAAGQLAAVDARSDSALAGDLQS